ncbi:MAG: hypothetical protein ACRD3J_14620 [Thermoanaerobaculia bacterium]
MILLCLRQSEWAAINASLIENVALSDTLVENIQAKAADPLWNPKPPRARTITIRDEGDSLPLLAVSVDFDQPTGVDQIWEETEIEWPKS